MPRDTHGVSAKRHMWRSEDTCGNWFSPFTMWIPGTELSSSGLTWHTLLPSELSHWPWNHFLLSLRRSTGSHLASGTLQCSLVPLTLEVSLSLWTGSESHVVPSLEHQRWEPGDKRKWDDPKPSCPLHLWGKLWLFSRPTNYREWAGGNFQKTKYTTHKNMPDGKMPIILVASNYIYLVQPFMKQTPDILGTSSKQK